MENQYKYEVKIAIGWGWVPCSKEVYEASLKNKTHKVRKTLIKPKQPKQKYKYELQRIGEPWVEVSKDRYDGCVKDGVGSEFIRKTPIEALEPEQPKPDYEGALKHVMGDLVNAKIVGRNILVGDLIAELSQYFNIDLKIKIE